MLEYALVPAAFGSGLLGFGWLALTQERHRARIPAACSVSAPAGQRTAGLGAILFGLPLCIAAEGAAFGALVWVLLTSAAALAVSFILTWQPRWLHLAEHAARLLRALPSRSTSER